MGNLPIDYIMNDIKSNKKSSISVLIIIWTILLLQYYIRIWCDSKSYTSYTIAFLTIIIAAIIAAFISVKSQKKLSKLTINLPLAAVWLLFCIFMLYSDIRIPKSYYYISLLLLVPFTMLFVIIGFMDGVKRNIIWNRFILAVEIAFFFSTIFCILFRPHMAGTRYSGFLANPNVYAKYLVTIWVCFIAKLDKYITKGNQFIYMMLTGIELGIVFLLLYRTGARTAFLAVLASTFLWFFIRLYKSRKNNMPLMRYLFSCMLGIIPGFILAFILLSKLPVIVNHPVEYTIDKMFVVQENTVCYAAEADSKDTSEEISDTIADVTDAEYSEPSLFQRILAIFNGESLDKVLNGRLSIYKSYIKKLNFKGHAKIGKVVHGCEIVDGERVANAHNSVIQIAYTYGIITALVFIFLILLTIINSIKYYNKYTGIKDYASLPMLITFAYIFTSLTESIFIPMQSFLALSFYFVIGELIFSKVR